MLVNLSKGDLGSDNSSLLGAVLVNQLLIAALSRRDVPEAERRPFHLYVDEYQNFATKTFPQLQSEARKYAIDTTVAHQYRDQLDDENKGSTLNVANIICLRVSGIDAMELARQFELIPQLRRPRYERLMTPRRNEPDEYTQKTVNKGGGVYVKVEGDPQPFSDVHLELVNELSQLDNYQAICRVLSAKEWPKSLHQFKINLIDKPPITEDQCEYIRHHSRELSHYDREGVKRLIDDYTRTERGDEDISFYTRE